MPRPTNEERIKRLEEQNNKVLEALEAERKARQEAEGKLTAKEDAERKEKDPMSGPGTLCEVTKITRSAAWQAPSVERVNPKTRTVETVTDTSKIPEGYAARYGPTNSVYIVESGKENRAKYPRDEEVVIPDCRSKYTRELSVYTKKEVQNRGNFKKEPPRMTVHLCENHAKMFGAKTDKQLKEEGKAMPQR